MNYFMRNIILWSWCLPQTLIGFFIIIFLRVQNRIIKFSKYEETTLIISKNYLFFLGLSLGKFIFVDETQNKIELIKHEYGHTLQNYLFGPFYLIIIGFPSIFQAVRFNLDKNFNDKEYENSFPEKWADKLGRVKEK